MADNNLMGFKRVSRMPSPKGRSLYDPLLNEVRKTGGIYTLNVEDKKRATNLSATIRSVIKKRGYDDVTVGMADTTVYVCKKK